MTKRPLITYFEVRKANAYFIEHSKAGYFKLDDSIIYFYSCYGRKFGWGWDQGHWAGSRGQDWLDWQKDSDYRAVWDNKRSRWHAVK